MDDAETIASTTRSGDAVFAPSHLRWVGLTALVLIVVDQLTKAWALSALESRDIDLVWTARFHLIFNHGSAFGLGNSYGRWVGLLVICVVIALLWYVRTIGDRLKLFLIGTIVGGAIGNLIDRVVRAEDGFLSGGVIDFIDFQWWPVFNVADMAVVLGAIGLVIVSMLEPEPGSAVEDATQATNESGESGESGDSSDTTVDAESGLDTDA